MKKNTLSDRLKAADQSLIPLINALESNLRHAIFHPNKPKFVCESNDFIPQMEYLCSHISNALASYLQVHGVIENTYKCRIMAQRYPWSGTPITRSDHLQFLWFGFTNYCYLFLERSTKFQQRLNDLCCYLKHDTSSVGELSKRIRKAIGSHIQHRGTHAHEWNIPHEVYSLYSGMEKVEEITSEYTNILPHVYKAARTDVIEEIDAALLEMVSIFEFLQKNELPKMLRIIAQANKMFETLSMRVEPYVPEEQETFGKLM